MNSDIEAALLRGEVVSGDQVFPEISDQGWEFLTPQPHKVHGARIPGTDKVVVGRFDDDKILWAAGSAYVAPGGDVDVARKGSITYTEGCQPTTTTTSSFKIMRGFGQTAVLVGVIPMV